MSILEQAFEVTAEIPRRNRRDHPRGYEPGMTFSVTEPDRPMTAVISSESRIAGDHRTKIEEQTGLKIPDGLDVRLERLTLQNAVGGVPERWWYKYVFVTRTTPSEGLEFESLAKVIRSVRRKPKTRPPRPKQATVAVLADPQTGKVASRGGTPELIARVQTTLEMLDDYTSEMKSDVSYLFDVGDAVESFENCAAQGFTNDLSLPRQVEAASDILFSFTDLLAKKHSELVVAGVGSNHCRWRRGKDALGLPGDDWGLHMLRQMRKSLSLNNTYGHVDVIWPDDHEETLAIDVCGTIIGLAHGHQVKKPDSIPDWWAKQTHGGQSVAHASLLLTGHFHAFRTQSTGRDPWTKKEKRWFQAPTLDNGSDWYRHISGEDSDPGLLVFTVNEHGWDNLRVLRPGR